MKVSGVGVSLWDAGNFLEQNKGDGYTTLYVC